MKLSRNYFLVLLFSMTVFVTSCSKDDEQPKGEFSSGVLVINEGDFTAANGTVTYYDPTTQSATQDIFGLKNNTKALGSVVQSATIAGDFAYVVVNNSNKVEVANADTFVSEYTLNDVSLPRYFTTVGDKGYLTEWVSFSDPGRVSVVNLTSHKVEATITTDYGAENIIAVAGKLFVSNNFSNTVSVIDQATNKETLKITIASSPAEIVLDGENKLWVICGGDYGSSNAALVRINPSNNLVEKTIPLGISLASHAGIALNKAKNQLYYFTSKAVYKMSTSATVAPASAFITPSSVVGLYGIGVDPNEDVLYIADAKGFQVNGVVYRYTPEGTAIDNFTAGKGPNGFIFR